jgi:tripartite-type tricarboxylate transporter receptor subunit TctC
MDGDRIMTTEGRDARRRAATMTGVIRAVLSLAVMLAAIDASHAQSAADFFRGKTLTMLVSTTNAGDYDMWARMVGRYMTKHLPGNPVFITSNMPGAGGIRAANYLYNVAPKDGTMIGIIGRNLAYDALVKHDGVAYDPTKFNWLGTPEITSRVCVAMKGVPVQRPQDLFDKELIVGGAGSGTSVAVTPVLLRNLLGMKFKVVDGYNGSSNVVLAMERGEVQGICQTISALRTARPGWIESGRMVVLFNLERTPIAGLNAPSVFAFAKTQEEKQILALYGSNIDLGRPFVTPPGVPADRVEALRAAFDAALADPEFLAEAEKRKLEVTPVKGETLKTLVDELMVTPPDFVKKLETLTRQE